jgi:hypothetical protein
MRTPLTFAVGVLVGLLATGTALAAVSISFSLSDAEAAEAAIVRAEDNAVLTAAGQPTLGNANAFAKYAAMKYVGRRLEDIRRARAEARRVKCLTLDAVALAQICTDHGLPSDCEPCR